MSHFAKVRDWVVVDVIVAEPEFFTTFVDTSPGTWIQTSYHGTIRKNFAGVGYSYDPVRDAFIPPKSFASWTLDDESCQWVAPVLMPDDGKPYRWDESTMTWVEQP